MKTLIIGGGGHAKSVFDCLSGKVEFGGFYADSGYAHLVRTEGIIDDALKVVCDAVFVAIGDNAARSMIAARFTSAGKILANVIAQDAVMSSRLFHGNIFIGHHAFVNAGTGIYDGVIVNSGCIVEHDCIIGSFSSLGPGVIVGGHVRIGVGCQIGMGAMIRDHVTIGDHCVIGMGSVVTKDIPSNSTGFGNPWKLRTTT